MSSNNNNIYSNNKLWLGMFWYTNFILSWKYKYNLTYILTCLHYFRDLFQKGMQQESTFYAWDFVLVRLSLSVLNVLVSNQKGHTIAGNKNTCLQSFIVINILKLLFLFILRYRVFLFITITKCSILFI